MNKLWAPWRKQYIRSEQKKGCFLCRAQKSSRDKTNYILERSVHGFAILNIYPYNNGHVLVVPNRHVQNLDALRDEEMVDLFRLSNKIIKRIRKAMRAQGFNVGVNLGSIAGAGLPGHVHFHIVPRWRGDTNFMPILSKTKIISESLDSVFDSLKKVKK